MKSQQERSLLICTFYASDPVVNGCIATLNRRPLECLKEGVYSAISTKSTDTFADTSSAGPSTNPQNCLVASRENECCARRPFRNLLHVWQPAELCKLRCKEIYQSQISLVARKLSSRLSRFSSSWFRFLSTRHPYLHTPSRNPDSC